MVAECENYLLVLRSSDRHRHVPIPLLSLVSKYSLYDILSQSQWQSFQYFEAFNNVKSHHYHHLPPWIRSFDLFRHRRIAIVSWGVHDFYSSRFVLEGVFRESGVINSFKVVDPVLFVFESQLGVESQSFIII